VAGRARHHVDDAATTALDHVRHDELDEPELDEPELDEPELVRKVPPHRLVDVVRRHVEDAVACTATLIDRVVEQRVDAPRSASTFAGAASTSARSSRSIVIINARRPCAAISAEVDSRLPGSDTIGSSRVRLPPPPRVLRVGP
jgi:hypothetical protein